MKTIKPKLNTNPMWLKGKAHELLYEATHRVVPGDTSPRNDKASGYEYCCWKYFPGLSDSASVAFPNGKPRQ